MEKFIPFEKLSKKKKRLLNANRRGSWHGLNPVTRKPENPKAYNRRKAQNRRDDPGSVPFVLCGSERYGGFQPICLIRAGRFGKRKNDTPPNLFLPCAIGALSRT